MKRCKKIISLFLCLTMMAMVFTACGKSETKKDNTGTDATQAPGRSDSATQTPAEGTTETPAVDLSSMDTMKIGVLVYDSTDAEVVAFKNYYQNYIAKNYPVEFTYSETISTAEEEVTAIENFINQKCKGIISFSDQDRAASIQMCEDAQVYYAVGAGTLNDEQYEEFKSYEYYVGSIGPFLTSEEEVGYNMAKYYLDQGVKNILVYAGGYPFVDMHKMRTDGFIRAFEEYGITYTPGENGNLGTFTGEGYTIDTISGFPDEAGAFWGTVGQKVGAAGVEVVISAALGVELFGTSIAQINPNIKLGTVASFTDAYKEAINAEVPQLDYLAGKFASSIGPVFIAMFNAITGNIDSVREEGNAFRMNQGYWNAVGKDQFNELYEVANSSVAPAYTADDLNQYCKLVNESTTFADFKAFVEAYRFEDIVALHSNK